MKKRLGIIGGSGLYEIEGMITKEEIETRTPFGKPSDKMIVGELEGTEVVFLARHGRGHFILPSEVNYRANIYAMKAAGAETILSVSAVGSMKEEIKPGELVVVDQFIDWTKGRANTFFGNGIVGHTSFADPVCPNLARRVHEIGLELGVPIHFGGTYICIEGPQFSSRAESLFFRSLGVSVIGMTNLPEAKLAREAGIAYATLALATDYDCWHQSEAAVNASAVLEVMAKNVNNAKKIIRALAKKVPEKSELVHKCQDYVIVTEKSRLQPLLKEDLRVLFGKHLDG